MEGIAAAADYLSADVTDIERRWGGRDAAGWRTAGLAAALRLFRAAAERVPAYKDFLTRRNVDPAAVVNAESFRAVPPMGKTGYVDQYPLADLMWDGDPAAAAVVHSSSGTTGASRYWPCGPAEVARSAALHELILTRCLGVGDGRTLLVVCFGMGTWIAGSHTSTVAQLIRQKCLPLTVATPGFNRAEALALLVRLGPLFDRVVVAGIPSFVKELVESWRPAGGGRVKLFLAGEGFPEGWRDHVAGLLGGRADDIISVLGSADAGLIGFESSWSIALRRLASGTSSLRDSLFSGEGVPAVFHYVPTHRYFEAEGGRLLLTADRALPLVRYDTEDRGGLLAADGPAGVHLGPPSPGGDAHAGGWPGALPCVYVFGRGQLAATVYGANVLPEYVQEWLVSPGVAPSVTGRFQLETAYTAAQDQLLRVHVELAGGVAGASVREWAEEFAALLCRRSSEYARIWQEYGPRALPEVVAYPFEHPERFAAGSGKKVS